MSERNRRLLWEGVRLAVLDIETVWDPGGFSGPARNETDRAIEQVRATGEPVRLAPQPRRIRWRQHAKIETAGLTSQSRGKEPDRAVEILPRAGAAEPSRQPAEAGGEFRAAWVAIVECKRGRPGAAWDTLVNPGVPVDPETARHHGLTDERLRLAPSFERIADEVLRRLTPADGETLVLVGHNLGYDLGVLRGEMRRIGKELPDLPVLDTMGSLATRVGKRAGRALLDLLADLGLPEPQPHHAADADARATAAAICALLDLAADRGDYDLPTLLTDLGSHTVTAVPANRPGRVPKLSRAPRLIRPEHRARHMPLAPEADGTALGEWIAVAEECAGLRCPELAGDLSSTVATSVAALSPGEPPRALLDALTEVSERLAKRADGPGVATVLDGVGLAYDLCCPVPLLPTPGGPFQAPIGGPGRKPRDGREWDRYPITRASTIALWHRLRALLAGLPRCAPADGCPRCWEGRPCGRDELVRRLAPGAGTWRWWRGWLQQNYSINHWLASDERQGWFTNREERTRRGGTATGAFAGPELADATLAWILRTYRAHGDRAERDKEIAYQIGRVLRVGGCGDPAFWEMVALERARPGREADLLDALAACDEGLAHRPAETTASTWASLAMTQNLLRLRLIRTQRGPEIRHHPGSRAKRRRGLRFAASGSDA